jgi:hypothetical protein
VLFTTPTNSFDNVADELQHHAKILDQEIPNEFPDIYPLKKGGMPQPSIGATVRLQLDSIVDRDWIANHGIFDLQHYEDNLLAALTDKIGTAATQDKVGRTIVIMDNGDFARIVGPGVLGYTVSSKVVMVPLRSDEWTVAHELAHTLPAFLWSSDQMLSECGTKYHNLDGSYAHGVEVTAWSQPEIRRRVEGNPEGIMRSARTTICWARSKVPSIRRSRFCAASSRSDRAGRSPDSNRPTTSRARSKCAQIRRARMRSSFAAETAR